MQPSCWLRHAFFLHTLVSYCAMHDTNLWRPLTIAIFGSFDQACILTAHTLFSSFFPIYIIYGCITLRLGTQSKSHVWKFTVLYLSHPVSHMHKSLRSNANMRDAHVAFVWFVCMFNVLLIYPR
jgi:uncharacterized protein YhhL (DUF1145 family)